MKRGSAVVFAAIVACLAALHFAWAAGWDRFSREAVPSRVIQDGIEPGTALFEPSPLATAGVGLSLALAASVVLRAGFTGRGRLLAMAICLAFGARAFGDRRYVGWSKRVRGTEFARKDDMLYSPLCLVLSLLAGRAAR